VRLRIDDLDDEGSGVGRADGLELHVAGALPGETVLARLAHRSPHAPRGWAELERLDGEPAAERVPPACPNHGRCGGCVLQHLAYPAQLSFKRRLVERALATHPSLARVPVQDVVAAPRELHYRNRAKYVLAARDGRLVLGSYAPGSHEVVDMAGCQVPEEPIDEVARAFARRLAAERVPAYDEATRRGELRHLVVRAGVDGDLLVVVVSRSSAPRAALARAARALRVELPAVAGVVLNLNPDPGNLIFGARDEPLDGAAALRDEVAGIPLELSARSFFQVNRAQAARLYAAVVDAARATRRARAVDLFCGAGAIALLLARAGARVRGVEIDADAVADARATAARLKLDVGFHAGDAAAGLAAAARDLGGLDVLVVNPPRRGLAGALAAVKAAAPPRLIYVSCNPRTLAADLAALPGYRVERVVPYDLMPGTPHVETLAVLSQ
jgi:23S rRNA (uracil1939-C5)-methyltransferase